MGKWRTTFLSRSIFAACALPLDKADCTTSFVEVLAADARSYIKNVWRLLKPTLTIMLLASVLAALMLNLVPWPMLLSHHTWESAALTSFLAVFMPVPIALDVMFAAQLQQSGTPPGFIMMFLMTLGTYSDIPAIYLWREVSRKLSIILFGFFWAVGFLCLLTF